MFTHSLKRYSVFSCRPGGSSKSRAWNEYNRVVNRKTRLIVLRPITSIKKIAQLQDPGVEPTPVLFRSASFVLPCLRTYRAWGQRSTGSFPSTESDYIKIKDLLNEQLNKSFLAKKDVILRKQSHDVRGRITSWNEINILSSLCQLKIICWLSKFRKSLFFKVLLNDKPDILASWLRQQCYFNKIRNRDLAERTKARVRHFSCRTFQHHQT